MKQRFIKYLLQVTVLAIVLISCKPEGVTYEMKMRPTEAVLLVGETVTLSPQVTPSVDAEFTYKSKDTEVATVSSKGVVTAVDKGETRVYAYCTLGGEEMKCYCNISVISAGLNITPASIELSVGGTYNLSAEMNKGATPSLTWSSSNTSVATVSQSGMVTARALGTSVITAKGGGYSATCEVTVSEPLSFNMSSVMLIVGEQAVLTVNRTGEVSWQTSNSNVATVSEGVVTGVGVGEATITATVGTQSIQAKVVVSNKLFVTTDPKATSGKTTGYMYLEVNQTKQLYTSGGSGVTWTSSNENIVSVDQTGLIKAGTIGCNTFDDWQEAVVKGKLGSYEVTLTVVVTLGTFNGYLFAPGNLRYDKSSKSWSISSLPENYVGANNKDISSSSYTGYIDLFGYKCQANPTLCSTTSSDYTSLSGNGTWSGLVADYKGNKSTISADYKWSDILPSVKSRNALYRLYYNNEWLLMLVPENFPGDCSDLTPGTSSGLQKVSSISNLKDAGAVFLPQAGYRDGTTYEMNGRCYRSAGQTGLFTDYLNFSSSLVSDYSGTSTIPSYRGAAVRLVNKITYGVIGDSYDSSTY